MTNIAQGAVKTILVVDDSAFMRKVITDILNSDESIRVIDTAKNGQDAIAKVKELKPDIITLDIDMPVMDGLMCLRELQKLGDTPVIMLSSHTREGAEATIKALAEGAIDFITKPANIFDMQAKEKKCEIIDKIKVAIASAKTKKEVPLQNIVKTKDVPYQSGLKNIVAIGTSTGGPKALQDVIPVIPADVEAAFLVVQHMPPGFTKSLAERLNGMSTVIVKEAEDGDVLRHGCVYLAPGDYHMLMEKNRDNSIRIKLSKDPPVGGHRPSVDVMMNALSNTGFTNIVGVIMTGMGGDGSEGIKKLKAFNKAYIIAQDEKTCTVYGMPKVAVQTGVVDAVVPLKEITNEIMKIVGVRK